MGSDVREKSAVLLILDAQNLNVLQRGKSSYRLLEDAQVLLRLHELLLIVDLSCVIPDVHRAKTILESGQDLTDSLSACTLIVTGNESASALRLQNI